MEDVGGSEAATPDLSEEAGRWELSRCSEE